eukprot:364822-Chlamydomonas_euryale.AAC.10
MDSAPHRLRDAAPRCHRAARRHSPKARKAVATSAHLRIPQTGPLRTPSPVRRRSSSLTATCWQLPAQAPVPRCAAAAARRWLPPHRLRARARTSPPPAQQARAPAAPRRLQTSKSPSRRRRR